MKMRGCSVLFVCALCVFVLCGAAAVVVAQEVTLEKAAEAASGKAKTAKEKGDEALTSYKGFNSEVDAVAGGFKTADTEITGKKSELTDLAKEGKPTEEDIKKGVDELAGKVKNVKTTLGDLKDADAAMFTKQEKKDELTKKMAEVEKKMEEVGTLAKAVTDKTPATKDVITKAGELEKVAEEASGLWKGAVQQLKAQLGKVKKAFDALTTAKDGIEKAVGEFGNNSDGKVETLTTYLTKEVKPKLTTPLEKITGLQTNLGAVNKAAEEAIKHYGELAEEARKVKQAAEKKEGTPQSTGPITNALTVPTGASATQETEDYSAGPLCSLALPAFFFCWCVLFGM